METGAAPAPIRMPRDLRLPSSIDTLVRLTGRQSRSSADCEPSAWYLRQAPFVRNYTTCDHSYCGPHDVIADASPPPSNETRDDAH